MREPRPEQRGLRTRARPLAAAPLIRGGDTALGTRTDVFGPNDLDRHRREVIEDFRTVLSEVTSIELTEYVEALDDARDVAEADVQGCAGARRFVLDACCATR